MESTEKKKLVDGGMVVPNRNSEFIRAFLEITKPYHKLSAREMDVAAVFIRRRYTIAAETSNADHIDKILFNKDTKKSVAAEAGITMDHFKTVLYKMRKHNVIQGNIINPTYLPNWQQGKPFRYMFIFNNDV